MTWTQEDEALLIELQRRKQAHDDEMRWPVEDAVRDCLFVKDAPAAAEDLIKYATLFRKVLKPFDKEKWNDHPIQPASTRVRSRSRAG